MKFRLVDLLACPICKTFPLKLSVFETYDITPPEKIFKCELYCAYHSVFVKDFKETDCVACYSKEIKTGLLVCPSCNRWYPIDEDIPRMLPDENRQEKDDVDFLLRWKDRIEIQILNNGKPFNLRYHSSSQREKI